ncbi:MAG: DegV family protein [Candidatus Heimdallarchaeota archaeon]
MQKVAIVTDSTCDIPDEIVADLGIIVVPLKVYMGKEVFTAGIDLTSEEFYEKMVTLKDTPSTKPPSFKAFYGTYEDASEISESIISIHISRLMSETIISAKEARKMLPHIDIRIYDSFTTGASLGLVVMKAAMAAKEGKSIDEISVLVEESIRNTRVVGIPETLKYLIKGGRIGRARGLIGNLLGMIPVLSVYMGETSSVTTVNGLDKAIAWIIQFLKEEGLNANSMVSLTHGNNIQLATKFSNLIRMEFKCEMQFTGLVGPVVGAHLGPGSIYFGYIK